MLETRKTYGWGGTSTGVLSKEQQQKWELCYHSEYGGFGIIGELYATEAEALNAGKEFKENHSWVTDFWARHPSKIYSTY